MLKPTQQLSLYANYIEGLQQGPIASPNNIPPLVNAGQVFPPNVSKQKEIGAKIDVGKFAFTMAFYDIEQPSSYVNDANRLVVDGLQRNRGLEYSRSVNCNLA